MRRHVMRTHGRLNAATAHRREKEADRLARMTHELVEESGDMAKVLLGLIERRAPNVSAVEATHYVLQAWRSDGPERDRLIAHAMKDPRTLELERALAREVQTVLRRFKDRALNDAVLGEMRAELVRFIVARTRHGAHALTTEEARPIAEASIELRPDRLSIRMEALLAAMYPAALPT